MISFLIFFIPAIISIVVCFILIFLLNKTENKYQTDEDKNINDDIFKYNTDNHKLWREFPKSYRRIIIVSFSILLFILLTYSSNFIFQYKNVISDNPADWGTFGDYFGGILNPVLSFITIILLLYTIQLQRVMKNDTNNDSKKQEFISNFFKMIDYYYNIIESLRSAYSKSTFNYLHEGLACFYFYRKNLKNNFTDGELSSYNTKRVDNFENRQLLTDSAIWAELRNYINHINAIMNFVSNTDSFDEKDKEREIEHYKNIFINQISREEYSVLKYYISRNETIEDEQNEKRHESFKKLFSSYIK
ncbi:MAG: hypothetical protein CVV44_12040 [Spirochaetae bacterium HGW-Spirochaetae-1]|jgi:uncharacterized membrane protein|nr:MAG: hypothetical protein CVV44_12040 [Spirochaetae bacterium HGW-Spirochaetae-1]